MVLAWWLWLLFGVLLLAFEAATPGGFFVFFFGVGAIAVGVLASAGLAGPAWSQWLLFGVLSGSALLLFRKPLQKRIRSAPAREVDSMIGETAVALAEMGAHQFGKVELRGTAWSAWNIDENVIAAGQRCRVEKIEGLMLHVRG